MSFDIVEGDPSNVVDAKWRSELYLSSHKLAIHMKSLAQLIFAASTILDDLAPFVAALCSYGPLPSIDKLDEIDDATRVLTLLNAHHYTGWNIRKLLILRSLEKPGSSSTAIAHNFEENEALILERCKRELKHISLAQSKRPKPSESWAHRTWVLRKMEELNMEYSKKEIVDGEKQRCQAAVSNHKRNYYAYKHRLYLLQHWISASKSHSDQLSDDSKADLREEFRIVWDWLKRNYQDASAVHYCCITLRHLGWNNLENLLPNDQVSTLFNTLEALLEESSKYLEYYSAGETWWYLRRFLISNFISYSLYENQSSNSSSTCEKLFENEVLTIARFSAEEKHALNALRHGAWISAFYKNVAIKTSSKLPSSVEAHFSLWMKELKSLAWKPSI